VPSKVTYVLGVSLGHESSAVLLRREGSDWDILAAATEERFTRKKNDDAFPINSTKYAISQLPNGGQIKQLGYCSWQRDEAFGLWSRWLKEPLEEPPSSYLSKIKTDADVREYRMQLATSQEMRDKDVHEFRKLFMGVFKKHVAMDLKEETLVRIPHHPAHALSTWFLSGFDRATVITLDGIGDGLSMTINRAGQPNRPTLLDNALLEPIAAVGNEGSLGLFYKYVTSGLGFRKLRDEGKVTGLAAQGNPEQCFGTFLNLFRFNDNSPGVINGWNLDQRFLKEVDAVDTHGGRFNPIDSWREYHAFGRQVEATVRDMIGKDIRREDIAAGAQAVLEHLALKVVNQGSEYILQSGKGHGKLAVAGGVFANVKLNQRIAEQDYIEELFITPPMGDPGVALGSAIAVLCKNGAEDEPMKPKTIHSMSFGPSFTRQEIERTLEKYKEQIGYELIESPEKLHQTIGLALSENNIVARFQGRMEFGPRALGNRSIYVPANHKGINDVLNAKLQRSDFMPFAPIVLEDYANRNLKNIDKVKKSVPFMTISLSASDDFTHRFPASVHVDGTTRAQSVSKENNSDSFGILKAYERLTGSPVIINTSFNNHGEPIVCTPEDAVKSFLTAKLDILAMDNYVIKIRNDKVMK
jgi:carbamoyltransferase